MFYTRVVLNTPGDSLRSARPTWEIAEAGGWLDSEIAAPQTRKDK